MPWTIENTNVPSAMAGQKRKLQTRIPAKAMPAGNQSKVDAPESVAVCRPRKPPKTYRAVNASRPVEGLRVEDEFGCFEFNRAFSSTLFLASPVRSGLKIRRSKPQPQMGGDDLENWKIHAKKGCQKRFRQQAWC
jgi:hypothetical protein